MKVIYLKQVNCHPSSIISTEHIVRLDIGQLVGRNGKLCPNLGDVSALGDCGGQVNYVFYARSFTEV